jgi:hypothetical protein
VIALRRRPHLSDVRSKSESPAFDEETELFLSNAPTLPEFVPLELDVELQLELELELARRPRRTLGLWVIAVMTLCASILASALSR